MILLGVLGLWNVEETPMWCAVYFVGLALHTVLLLRAPTRTRASFEASAIASLATVPVVLGMERQSWPFSAPYVGDWNTVLDDGEVNWTLWPYAHLLLWWPAWEITRRIRWPRRPRSDEGATS
jgi:hypothetical protein